MDEYFKRNIAKRMMCYVHDFHRYFQYTTTEKYKKGVLLILIKTLLYVITLVCYKLTTLIVVYQRAFTRYKFKGFDWTEETLMLELENYTK